MTLRSSTIRRASMQNSPSPSTSMMGIRPHNVFSPSHAVIVNTLPLMEKRKLLSMVNAFLALMTLLTEEAKLWRVLLGTVNFISVCFYFFYSTKLAQIFAITNHCIQKSHFMRPNLVLNDYFS